MGLAAARMTDTAAHGGMIIMGSTKVLIGGMPAARVGDPIVCPGFTGPVPHIMGNITMGSTTVMIDGAYAARQTDTTGCGVAGVSGANMPAVSGPPAAPSPASPSAVPGSFDFGSGSVTGNGNEGWLWGSASGYNNEDGRGGVVDFALGHSRTADDTIGGDLVRGTVEGRSGIGGDMVRAQGSGFVPLDSNDGTDSTKISNFNASVLVDVLNGTDGRRTGFSRGIGAQVSMAQAEKSHRFDRTEVPHFHVPFTDFDIDDVQVTTTGGFSFLSLGEAVQAGAYHDAADNRVHLNGLIDIEVMLGLSFGIDISFGSDSNSPPPIVIPGIGIPMTPGTVIMGFSTVLIG